MNYHDFEMTIERMVQQIINSGEQFDCLVGISRGGLVPAVHLAHALNLPLETINWQTRDGFQKEVKEHLMDKKCLFVDDINDSGKTLNEIQAAYGQHSTAVCFQRVKSDFIADFVGELVEDDSWLVFPWEESKTASLEV